MDVTLIATLGLGAITIIVILRLLLLRLRGRKAADTGAVLWRIDLPSQSRGGFFARQFFTIYVVTMIGLLLETDLRSLWPLICLGLIPMLLQHCGLLGLASRSIEIRERGLLMDSGFIPWECIKDYRRENGRMVVIVGLAGGGGTRLEFTEGQEKLERLLHDRVHPIAGRPQTLAAPEEHLQ